MKKIIIIMFILLSLSLCANIQFAKDLFDDALYEEAINEFEKVIAASPTSGQAQESLFYIGECYRLRKQFAKAERTYERLLDGYPTGSFRERTLYYLGIVNFQQEKYDNAIDNFEILLKKYPLSTFAKQSLTSYIQSYYELKEYQRVIILCRKLIKDYKDYHGIPDIMLLMGRSYFAANIPDEGKKTLKKIMNEYSDRDIRWKALELKIEILEKEKGPASAAEELSKNLEGNIPRSYEEILRNKLAEYYFILNKYEKAYLETGKLVKKFDSSLNLDKYIIRYSFCQLQLHKYEELVTDYSEYKKVFKKSSLKAKYMLHLAKSQYYLKNFFEAESIIKNILSFSKDEKVNYESNLLKANIRLDTGKLSAAINSLQKLIENKYADKDELWYKIGNIYFDQFRNYSKAIKYYQRIVTGYSSPEYQQKASYKIALCFEKLGKFNEAVSELEQINLDDVDDLFIRLKISEKKQYLKKFKQQNYEIAFNRLLDSLVKFTEDNNRDLLQEELFNILVCDLKEYERTINLLEGENEPEDIYQKAKLYLILIEKLQAESKENKANEYLVKVGGLISKLDKTKNIEWITELDLMRELISKEKIEQTTIGKMETFIKKYPNSSALNEFILNIADFYKAQNNMKKAAVYYEKLMNDSQISDEDYFSAKIFLAEYYYSADDDDKALQNYRIADSGIDLDHPEIFFHYSVVLNESGNAEEAKDKLAFLLNNVEYYDGFGTVVKYFAEILRNSGKHVDAVKYQLLIPQDKRSDEYYILLADDYLAINEKENAKESLMYIIDKNNEVLGKLGMLQFETNDLEMAEYTYNELLKKNKNDLKNYEMSGRIAFIREDFLDAANNYKQINEKLGNNFTGYENISQVAKEYIVSLYRIENRPKAETLTSKFKKLFTAKEINEIELNRAIYHIKLNKKKAESIFSKLVKGKNVTNNSRIKAYFWRGVVRLELKKTEEAESDFETVANSIDEDLSMQAHLKLGTINFSNEKYKEALNHYFLVIEKDKDGKVAFDAARNFAFVCKTIEEWQKAVAAYQIILDRWGDAELEGETLFDIAFCHYRDKKYDNAIEAFSNAIPKLNSRELKAEAQYWIGESYFGLEDHETAVAEFLKVGYNYSEFTQWAASAELKAGEAYQSLKKIEKARRIYERIIEKYGKFSQWGTEAVKRLENL